MNLATINGIVTRTHCDVATTIDENATTIYELTKSINGQRHTVTIPITAEAHANHDADTIIQDVVSLAAYQFAELRKQLAAQQAETPNE